MEKTQGRVRGRSSIIKKTSNVMLRLVWHLLHLIPIIWHFILAIVHTLQSYLISSGLLKKYKALDLAKLQYLAIVIESQEAYDTTRVVKLLRWLSNMGIEHICLYDMDGVLKKCKRVILEELGDEKSSSLEFVSFSDGKEGVAKAANFLFRQYIEVSRSEEMDTPIFTEANMAKALTAVGCGGPQPNLLLVYAPVRCHLGFPAWRMRYTEITYGIIEIHETRGFNKSDLQVRKSAPKLWYLKWAWKKSLEMNTSSVLWIH